MQIPSELIKSLNGKNSAVVALLIIAICLAYSLTSFASELLNYNKSFIENLAKSNEKLDKIYEILKEHQKSHKVD